MQILDKFYRFFLRFRYPVSLPENVAEALGASVSNFLTFDQFVHRLTNPYFRPERIKKYMPREEVEKAFESAQRQERFLHKTLCSYYFSEGWVEFVLLFDENSKLRRIYLLHKSISKEEGVEIHLESL